MMIETSQQIKDFGEKLDAIVLAIDQIENDESEKTYIVITTDNTHQPRRLFPVEDELITKQVLAILKEREEHIRQAIRLLVE